MDSGHGERGIGNVKCGIRSEEWKREELWVV
jgi:hypothetical protein